MRRATEADMPAVTAFLRGRLERAMFPLGNYLSQGLGEGHPFAMTFWLAESDGGIGGVLGQTARGILLPVLPRLGAVAGAELRGVTGIVGPTDEVRHVERVLDLRAAPRTLDHDEAHLALDLAHLAVPEGPGVLRPMAEAPEAEIRAWMADYHRATLSTPERLVPENVDAWWRRATEEDTHRVLIEDGRALAMTGFNSRVPEMVQLGGVYTPPALRGRGHARRAVALDLLAARSGGAVGATLFSASEPATHAYAAIGFRRIGSWTLLLFDGPQHV